MTDSVSLGALFIEHTCDAAGTLRLSLKGDVTVKGRPSPLASIQDAIATSGCKRVMLDLSGVRHMDSYGITLIASVKRVCMEKGLGFEFRGEPVQMQRMIGLLDLDSLAQPPPAGTQVKAPGSMVRLGELTILFLQNLRFLILFVGELVVALAWVIRHPRRLRLDDTLRGLEVHGVNALPIITLINLLVGMVLAFQAAIQLKQFGANIYVANLVGLAQTREFGPMITAVLLAGRSGSAFAAEIGSMMVNEEVDALKTMGMDPIRFLVIPKMLALLVALPVLALYADVLGIVGGLVVSVTGLDLTVQGYLLQIQKTVGLFDVFSGIIKTVAFAIIIAGIGCLRGFQVKGGATAVGSAATSAVVSGIFLIILVDAIFTVIFQYV